MGSWISTKGKVMKKSDKKVRKDYKKPEVKKHENLKDITLLSFQPPDTNAKMS